MINVVNCVSGFVLDYMHLVLLGVTRRLIEYWKGNSPDNVNCRLSQNQITIISNSMTSLRGAMPFDFARQPRSFRHSDRWKATEYRQFLLYTGPIILSDILDDARYRHFMSLSVGLSILLIPDEEKRQYYITFARELLTFFVQESVKLYGETFVSYNVHNVLHICNDCELYNLSQCMKCSLIDHLVHWH